MSYIKGNFKQSIFNGSNGYTVGLFKVKETSDDITLDSKTVTFTGYFYELNDMDTYIFHGSFVVHNKYGEQFVVTSYERCKPEDKDSIVEFLSSGLFKGIGVKKAEKIVNALGKNTLDTILNNPSNLILIPTVTQKNIDVLHDTLLNYENSYQVIITLSELGFTTKDSMVIYNKYKHETIDVINSNLYKVIEDIKDIGFKKIDSIAIRKGYSLDDQRRVQATILYVMNELCNLAGHSYLLYEEIYSYTNKVLNIRLDNRIFNDIIESLLDEAKIVIEKERYYLTKMYEAEDNVARRIKYLVNKSSTKYKDIDKKLQKIEILEKIEYNDVQKDAIKRAITDNFLIITGGPGTGKTTIVKAITDLYMEVNKLSYQKLIKEMVLLAPTGRASKRLASSTLLPSSTIHRFLKWNKETNTFGVNEYNKSEAKIIIIDEASMVDIYLWDSLLKGLLFDTKIIVVGDYDQLPSVGPGQVLKDLIESDVVPVIKLEYLYRQQKGSNIISLAYDINKGHISEDVFNQDEDLIFINNEESVVESIKEICKKYKKEDYNDFQILAPMYKTKNGIDNLNKALQELFNPKSRTKKEVVVGEVVYREGDKILQLTNMPDENIFNGDIGVIKSVDKKEINIDFDGHTVRFTPSNYSSFQHGYAISVHKSQGSEFKTVILVALKEYNKMLYRKLYYTGVTRCKNKLYIVGSVDAIKKASINTSSDTRRTTLKENIINRLNVNK